jgi:hypothetical protein
MTNKNKNKQTKYKAKTKKTQEIWEKKTFVIG